MNWIKVFTEAENALFPLKNYINKSETRMTASVFNILCLDLIPSKVYVVCS